MLSKSRRHISNALPYRFDQAGSKQLLGGSGRRIKVSTASLLSTLILCGEFGTSIAAQDTPLEEIMVTGTRIARDPNLSGPLPVQSIGAEDFQQSSQLSVINIVNDLPALLTSTTGEMSILNSGLDLGANVLDLRGLGSSRTLVLVNGRRHVAGVQGTGSVDVGSIPKALVERVEVLTGGASAVYGADAVTGVVNFIMKDHFEGFSVDGNYGLSSRGDSARTSVTATWGQNFADDRGNIAISVDYGKDEGLTTGERSRGDLVGSARNGPNPDRVFQIGEINGSTTPNFAHYFSVGSPGKFGYGMNIPSTDKFIADYTAAYGVAPTLTAAEMALIDRAKNAPPSAILPATTFPFTSAYGIVSLGNPLAPRDASTPIDLNNNGVPDCLDSFTGYSSTMVSSGGCWNISRNGTYSPVMDGLIGSTFAQNGGDSHLSFYRDNPQNNILPPDDLVSVNVFGHFDFTDSMTGFAELKYVGQKTQRFTRSNSFWDNAPGLPDNPFLPEWLRPIAAASGGVAISLDPEHFNKYTKVDRDTARVVLGIRGELDGGMGYEISAYYGRFKQTFLETNHMIADRFFAAIDVVTDPRTGKPVCRVDLDPNAAPGNSLTGFPVYDPGYYSFTPGAGQCVPLNIWAGQPGVTPEAANFVTQDIWNTDVLDQLVFSANVTGSSEPLFVLPAGAVKYAAGAEFRRESSRTTFDPWQRGVIPAGSILPAGSNVADVSKNRSLMHRPDTLRANEHGSYDVSELFVELSAPLLRDLPAARELTLGLAARFSDYSTVGRTTTWKTDLVYAPINSVSLRSTYSKAVRAPNITELFGPELGVVVAVTDPCQTQQIAAIAAKNPTLAKQIQANCVASFAQIGFNPIDPVTGAYNYTDTNTGAFSGVSGGNRNLSQETAETFTAGIVFRPEFISGLSMSLDYWNIKIDNAIANVSSQNIVDGCYQGAALNATFCDLLARNSNASSFQFGSLNFLRQTEINFAKSTASGLDFSLKYAFQLGQHAFSLGVQGTRVYEIDNYTNPLDLTVVDPSLGELTRPKLAGKVSLGWNYGNLFVGWQAQYMGEQLLRFAAIETADTQFGSAVTMGDLWIQNLNARYSINDHFSVYGGIENVTDVKPFITERAYPASARGTFYFLGVKWDM